MRCRPRWWLAPAALALVAALLIWRAYTPAPLTEEERALVGRWAYPRGDGWVEFRDDRSVQLSFNPNRTSYRWQMERGVYWAFPTSPRPATPVAWVRSLFAASQPPLVHRITWDGPDAFQCTFTSGVAEQEPMTLMRLR